MATPEGVALLGKCVISQTQVNHLCLKVVYVTMAALEVFGVRKNRK